MQIGQYLRDKRREQRRSLHSVASNAGISVGYLSDLERGFRNLSTPSWSVIERLAGTLNISPDYLAFLAGIIPGDIWAPNASADEITNAFNLFRKHVDNL